MIDDTKISLGVGKKEEEEKEEEEEGVVSADIQKRYRPHSGYYGVKEIRVLAYSLSHSQSF